MIGLLYVLPLEGDGIECGADDLDRLFQVRNPDGQWHLEIARTDVMYPLLWVLLKDDVAVVWRVRVEGEPVEVANGDGSVPDSEWVEFRSRVGVEWVTGEHVIGVDRALRIVRALAEGELYPKSVEWIIPPLPGDHRD